jgi:simple sugar transport system substrate-binding protein
MKRRDWLRGGAALIGGALASGAGAVARAAGTRSIVTVVKIIGVQWFNRMDEGVKQFAADNPGVSTQEIGPPQADAALQVQMIQDLIARRVNAICVVPNSPETLEPVLKHAMSRKIAVIGHEGSDLKNVDYDLEAFDNRAYGEHLMQALATRMGGQGEYAVFVGHLTAKSHNEWVDGAIALQKAKYPNMKLVTERVESNEDQQTAYTKTKELLRAYPNLKGFQGSGATDVAGIGLAIEEAGLKGKVAVVGTSLVSVSGKYLQSGAISMISFWDPKLAGYVMNKLALMVLNGQKVTDGQNLGVTGYEKVKLVGKVVYGKAWVDVTKENMKEYSF